jgi:hypothetical protein
MLDAKKREPLDFSKISKEPPMLYRRSVGTGSIQQKKALLAKLSATAKKLAEQAHQNQKKFTV